MCDYLENLISKHNQLFIDLFDEHLSPKFHFTIHYPYIMKMVGPIRKISSMRYMNPSIKSLKKWQEYVKKKNLLYSFVFKKPN